VLGGCARAHPPDVAPELVIELETRSRAFIRICSRCILGGFTGAVSIVMVAWTWSWEDVLGFDLGAFLLLQLKCAHLVPAKAPLPNLQPESGGGGEEVRCA
jgi:hypothetical protein